MKINLEMNLSLSVLDLNTEKKRGNMREILLLKN